MSVSKLCVSQHAKNPTQDDERKLLRVVGYLAKFPTLGTVLGESNYCGDSDTVALSATTDASHAVYPEGHSHGGHIIQVGTPGLPNICVVDHTCSKSKVISRASMGSEVQYLLGAADKAEFLRQTLDSVELQVPIPMPFFTDSNSTLHTMRRSKLSPKMIHEIVRNNYLKQLVDKGVIELVYVSTDVCKSDLFTKYLPSKRFHKLLEGMMVEVKLRPIV
jgi:hypothetical protein